MSAALTSYHMLECRKCHVTEDLGKREMFKCGKCIKNKNPDPAVYCSRACQKADWENGHKGKCKNVPPEVVAARARSSDGHDWCQDWRKCDDGSLHSGDLELITWDGEDSDGEETELGFGGYVREESDDARRIFEVKMGGDRLKFLEEHDNSFRWTCCGLTASQGVSGCDHHGDPEARLPCGCDFCKMGKPLSADILSKRQRSQRAQGLTLRNGPDPRSLNPMAGGMAEIMRGVFGMDT